jgi:LuxR family quorum sensing-dependent transcriptional regulator
VANFDDTLAYIDNIQKARTPEEICRTLIDVTSRFGLTALLAGTIPRAGAPREELPSHILLCDWPAGWMERYVAMNYVDRDPLVTFLRRNLSAVSWHDAIKRVDADRAARRVYDEAGAFRLNDGFAMPIVTVEGEVVIVSLGGEEIDLSQEAIGVVSLVSTFAIGRAVQLSAARDTLEPRPALTDREKECMRWAALGKSEWEISQILGISEHTSEKHLLSAKTKLRAVNRVQAVAEAIRQGYIS